MIKRALLMLGLIMPALVLGGCVISETEKGPGPGDQKKEEAPAASPDAKPAAPTR